VTCRLVAALALFGIAACDKASDARPEPRPPSSVAPPVAKAEPHAEHDCSQAHPDQPRPAPATATWLSDEARGRLTTLRASAHQGSVTARKGDQGFTIAGPRGCTVSAERIERALDNLRGLTAERSDESPQHFELQVIVLSGEERLLHFDVAGRSEGADLVQLNDGSSFRISGLDRELWSPDPAVWCASEQP
jgi:hypothetical protein